MAFGPFLFLILAALAIVLLVIGITTFLWLPLLVVAVCGVFWVPVAALFHNEIEPSGSGESSGVPSTAEASYEPVQQPEQRL
jgi:hypothetical protein